MPDSARVPLPSVQQPTSAYDDIVGICCSEETVLDDVLVALLILLVAVDMLVRSVMRLLDVCDVMLWEDGVSVLLDIG